MKRLVLILLVWVFFSCTKSTHSLERERILYQDLPTPVKKKIFYPNNGVHSMEDFDNPDFEDFQEINTPSRYDYYTKQHFFFPWIYTPYIRNKATGQVYLVETRGREMGGRYVVYGDSLYIANHYNILEQDSLSYTFARFILK